ncbi:MAG: hypothetical protein MI725_13785, partial [Pirellulales bacterium]|nr:hypothetical protein [Pirellulales bacterium]
MRCVCPTLALCLTFLLSGCRTQTATLSNPFLAPDRVPPPATRTLMPGTAQPYYPGDPVPNSPAIAPPGAVPTYAPPAGQVVPPGGWNTTPQPAAGSTSRNNIPTGGVRHASAEVPLGHVTTADDEPVRVQTDEHNLRFAQQAPPQPVNQIPSTWSSPIQPQPGFSQEITPTSAYPGQLTGYQAPVAQPRPVQIRALPPNQPTTGGF